MILKYLPVVRKERSPGSKKRYRYLQPAILKCEICGIEREICNLTGRHKRSVEHPCLSCTAEKLGKANQGNAYNLGIRKPKNLIQKGAIYETFSGYLEVYLGRDHGYCHRKDKYVLIHRLIAELMLNRPLKKEELIHHIDGDKQNNSPDNLAICENMQEHRRIHNDLEKLAMVLVANGVIQFDKDTKSYKMPHLKEILNAYRVNSEETYVLDLENMAILSQADELAGGHAYGVDPKARLVQDSEGATTIPLGSRDRVISKRTATYLKKKEG
jgi:hypothetical protein